MRKIIPFGLVWGFYALIYLIVEKGLLGNLTHYPATGNEYNFQIAAPIVILGALVVGWFMGTIEIIFIKNYFNKYAFTIKVFCKTIVYFFIIMLFILTLSMITNGLSNGTHPFTENVLTQTKLFTSNFAFWSIVIYTGSIILITVFLAEIADHLGQGVLLNFIFGKYHKPNEEDRIFMFLDMNASTMIAERLGNMKYFELLKEYFADMSGSILKTNGEVYQYVGDEIVISWEMKDGLKKANCICCFYEIKKVMKDQKDKYLRKYQFFPTFKAGVHMGKVTSGKIGTLKQDILYTGDVLNTTARIEGYCSVLNSELLISKVIKEELEKLQLFNFQDIGFHSLRGRMKGMQIFSCEQKAI